MKQFILLLVIIATISTETLPNPGIKLLTNEEQLTSLINQVTPIVQKRLLQLTFNDTHFDVGMAWGNLTNIHMKTVDFNSQNTNFTFFKNEKTGQDQVKLSVWIEKILVGFEYHIRVHAPGPWSRYGCVSASIGFVDLRFEPVFTLKNKKGKFQPVMTGFDFEYRGIYIDLCNRDFVMIAVPKIRKAIKYFLEDNYDEICNGVKSNFNKELPLIPSTLPIEQIKSIFDFSMIGNAKFDLSTSLHTVELDLNGAFYKQTKDPHFLNPKKPLVPFDTTRTQIIVSKKVFKSLLACLVPSMLQSEDISSLRKYTTFFQQNSLSYLNYINILEVFQLISKMGEDDIDSSVVSEVESLIENFINKHLQESQEYQLGEIMEQLTKQILEKQFSGMKEQTLRSLQSLDENKRIQIVKRQYDILVLIDL